MSERSKEPHSRCGVATLEGSNPSLCIFCVDMRSDKNKGVVAVGQPQAQEAHEVSHGHAQHLPLAHLGHLLQQVAQQAEHVRQQEPHSDVAHPLHVHQPNQLSISKKVLVRCGWFRYE